MKTPSPSTSIILTSLLMPMAALSATSDDQGAGSFKATIGHYQYADFSGRDLNLRWQKGDTHAWVGNYQDADFGSQSRAGWDSSYDLTDLIAIQPSLQVATRGFAGGSINAQIGHEWFGLAGLGRTNLKPYFNLNFDPNDAFTLGGGHAFENGQTWSVFVIKDNRTHTGQTDWHLLGRLPMADQRLTIDVMEKSGQSDVGYIKAWGASLTWDWPTWFARVARDPKQNFSAQDAWRVSTGFRF